MIRPDRSVLTVCPYCGVGCSLLLRIKDERIYRADSPYESPVNHGNLCVKGRYGWDFAYSPERVTVPLVRKERQVPGDRRPAPDRSAWREASWDEALDLCAERLSEIYGRDGPRAMAVFCCAKATNEDNYLLQKLFRSLFRSNNVDHCTRLCHAGSVFALQLALGSSAMSNTAAEVLSNDVFIVTGSNTTETHPIISLQMKEAVEKRGAKLIVADPRRIEMTDFAALWLRQRPGTDVPLFSAMAQVILKEGLANKDFIERRTEGYAEFASSMEKFTPEYAEGITGVKATLIVEAARLYARAERAAIYWALGIPEHTRGTENALALINLCLLAGQIGREGTGLNPLRGQNNVQGASDWGAMPWHFPGYQRVDDKAAARKFEEAWGIESGGLNRIPGLTNTEIVNSIGEGGVRAMMIMGENPIMSEPNSNHTRKKFEGLEFLVAQDLFLSETAAYADVFLPAASWAEKEGTFTNTDRRVQLVRKAIEPLGSSRPDWRIISELGERIEGRLGIKGGRRWSYGHPSEIMEEMARTVPDYAGIAYARLEGWGLQTPVPDEGHPGTPFLFAESFPRGRALFHPLEYKPSAELPDGEYPFLLTTGRVLEHWHGGTLTRASNLDELRPQAAMELNPEDAERLGIAEGEPARVSSRRGSIVLRAWVTDRVAPGIVFIPFFYAEAAANELTNDAIDPRAKIPEYKVCAVRIEKAGEGELKEAKPYGRRGAY
jgi:formate dehydrogenase alpha subunit